MSSLRISVAEFLFRALSRPRKVHKVAHGPQSAVMASGSYQGCLYIMLVTVC